MTIELCLDACNAAGYSLAGAEYASQCYCDNTYITGGPASDQNNLQHGVQWATQLTTVGGPGAMNLYSYGGANPCLWHSAHCHFSNASDSSSAIFLGYTRLLH